METIVYKVTLEYYSIYIDEWEEEFNDMYPTKKTAIRICQSIFAKRHTNEYVKSVHAEVRRITITDKGIASAKRIYNKFKKTN